MGEPSSYLALAKGTPVLTATGTSIGTVEHVLQDDSLDLFDGIVVKTRDGLRFVDANRVMHITTTEVATSVAADEVASLGKPDGDPLFEADPEQFQEIGLTAWFGRTFMREHWTRNPDQDEH